MWNNFSDCQVKIGLYLSGIVNNKIYICVVYGNKRERKTIVVYKLSGLLILLLISFKLKFYLGFMCNFFFFFNYMSLV